MPAPVHRFLVYMGINVDELASDNVNEDGDECSGEACNNRDLRPASYARQKEEEPEDEDGNIYPVMEEEAFASLEGQGSDVSQQPRAFPSEDGDSANLMGEWFESLAMQERASDQGDVDG